jgi:hypothetical protein
MAGSKKTNNQSKKRLKFAPLPVNFLLQGWSLEAPADAAAAAAACSRPFHVSTIYLNA